MLKVEMENLIKELEATIKSQDIKIGELKTINRQFSDKVKELRDRVDEEKDKHIEFLESQTKHLLSKKVNVVTVHDGKEYKSEEYKTFNKNRPLFNGGY